MDAGLFDVYCLLGTCTRAICVRVRFFPVEKHFYVYIVSIYYLFPFAYNMQTATWWCDSTGTPKGWDTGKGDVCTARRGRRMEADSSTYTALRWLTGTLRWDLRGETLNTSATLTLCPLQLHSWPVFAGLMMLTVRIIYPCFKLFSPPTVLPPAVPIALSLCLFWMTASVKGNGKCPNFDNYQKDQFCARVCAAAFYADSDFTWTAHSS